MRNALILSLGFLVAIYGSQATAQEEIEAGFEPQTVVPTLSLPPRANTLTSVPTAPAPTVTSVDRNGGKVNAIDMSKTPQDALKAASSSQEPSVAPTTIVTPQAASENPYTVGSILYGDAKVFDGHSMLVSGHPVRLHGVETPGMKQTCTTAQGTSWRCGFEAFSRLSELVSGQKVKCVVEAKAGKGAAATCSASKTKDIGQLLVQEGLAIPTRFSAGKYSGDVASASMAKRGMWIGGFKDPVKWRSEN